MKKEADKVLFGYVNSLEERDLRHKFQARCSYHCVVRRIGVGSHGVTEKTFYPSPSAIHLALVCLGPRGGDGNGTCEQG